MNDVSTEVRSRLTKSALALSFYMVISITQVFLNKLIFLNSNVGGLYITWFQFVVAEVCILIRTFAGNYKKEGKLIPEFNLNYSIIAKVLPVTVVYISMIGLNNITLKYTSISTYQIVRSLSVFFNILVQYFILKKKTSINCTFACTGVVLGFIVGSCSDIQLSAKGLIYGLLSSLASALYSIVVKEAIGILNNDEFRLMQYNTPIAILCLAVIIVFNGDIKYMKTFDLKGFGLQFASGIFGYLVNIAIFLNIKYTSSLTHNLSGSIKSTLQTLLSYIVFKKHETINFLKGLSIFFTILFSGLYSVVRAHETRVEIDINNPAKYEKSKKRIFMVLNAFIMLFIILVVFSVSNSIIGQSLKTPVTSVLFHKPRIFKKRK